MSLKRNYGKLYGQIHRDNYKHFSGRLGDLQIKTIAELVELVNPDRMLDYGSGKGYQYLGARSQDQWGGLLPHCYDPGVIHLANKPEGTFAGIICTDVLEHIDPDDMITVLVDIFGFLHPVGRPVFAYFHISTTPARKTFADGENVHLTIRPPEWWNTFLGAFVRKDLTIKATYGD